MNPRRALRVAALVAALPAFACASISASITSPSDSISGASKSIAGSFDAISTSSGSGGQAAGPNQQSYERDLREYTALFATTPGGTREDFLRGVARIAEDHGISHWEAESATPRAIGAGLRDARLSPEAMDALVESIGRERPEAQLALEGYRRPGG